MKPLPPPIDESSVNAVSEATASETAEPSQTGEEHLAGDRGIPALNRARSVQSRLSSVLAISLMAVLGLGLLTWYYTKALTRPAQQHQAAQAAVKQHAQGEMALPSLGHISPPPLKAAAPPPSDAPPTAVAQMLGPAPPAPPLAPPVAMGSSVAPMPVAVTPEGAPQKSPGQLAFERKLAGPSFASASSNGPDGANALPVGLSHVRESAALSAEGRSAAAADPLNALLQPTVTPAQAASVLPTRRFLLAKGAFIDCTLETAIDSTLPGMTTCVTATDTFSADGTVVLLERGTKLVGETRGQVAQGASRIFVLWTEARTPTGVIVPLSSPGTDELGRSGLSGEVNRHFWDRFGAAILLTVINGAVQGAVNSHNNGGSVIISPTTATDVMTEVLRGTLDIPPTVTKAQGDRIQVFVARDVDFRSVYELHSRIARAEEPAASLASSP